MKKIKKAFSIVFGDRILIHHEGLEYRYFNPSIAKRLNMLKSPLVSAAPALINPNPHILHIGVTTACNLKCPACPSGTGALTRKPKHLSFDVYKDSIETFKKYLLVTYFWDWGEPLLHPKFCEMVNYASKNNIITVSSTNGNAFNSVDNLKRFVESGLDLIFVCVDGATQETYEKYRIGGKLKEVLTFTERLNAIKAQLKSAYPVVVFRTLPTKYNESEIPTLEKMAVETGSEIFSLKSFRPWDYHQTDLDEEFVPENKSLRRYDYANSTKTKECRTEKGQTDKFNCRKPIFTPTLDSDGNIRFCCYESSNDVFGQAKFAGDCHRIWYSRDAMKLRQYFLKNNGNDICKTCYFRSVDLVPTVIKLKALRSLPPKIGIAANKLSIS
jgi:MoaA/NifB/PqqE/SkfB family radical SAM enzyme